MGCWGVANVTVVFAVDREGEVRFLSDVSREMVSYRPARYAHLEDLRVLCD